MSIRVFIIRVFLGNKKGKGYMLGVILLLRDYAKMLELQYKGVKIPLSKLS